MQEVEKVREAHKAAAKCTNGSNCGNGTKCTERWRKKEQAYYYYWEGALASKKDIYLLPVSNQGVM